MITLYGLFLWLLRARLKAPPPVLLSPPPLRPPLPPPRLLVLIKSSKATSIVCVVYSVQKELKKNDVVRKRRIQNKQDHAKKRLVPQPNFCRTRTNTVSNNLYAGSLVLFREKIRDKNQGKGL